MTMRSFLTARHCQEAFAALGEISTFGEVLRYHDANRFRSVQFGFGDGNKRHDFYYNAAYLEAHCERVSDYLQRGGYFAKHTVQHGEFLVKGKDIYLNLNGCVTMVVDTQTVTEADIEAVLQHFYAPTDEEKAQIFVLLKDQYRGYFPHRRQLRNVAVDLENSYGEGFLDFHQHTTQSLRDKNGLVLLHGAPGTGKTTYIKYLTSLVERDFIFVPEFLSDAIASPDILPLLMRMNRPVIIIEDAEKMLVSRDTTTNNLVSSVLNLSNGILGDCLEASVICTFNTNLQNIDRALLREGRLIGNWEFDLLDVERCRKIAQANGIQIEIEQPMSVSQIINHQGVVSNTNGVAA
jgi:hypothetical protein